MAMLCICMYKMSGDNSIFKRGKVIGDKGGEQGGSNEVRIQMALEIIPEADESSDNITDDIVESGGW